MLVGLDFVGALGVAFGAWRYSPPLVDNAFAQSIYLMGTSILSIIFSVFFAALAILMSAGSDAFVRFLDEKGGFTRILFGFKFTLALLFVALLCAVLGYSGTSAATTGGIVAQSRIFLSAFALLSSWALFASFAAAWAAVRYGEMRLRFIKAIGGRDAG